MLIIPLFVCWILHGSASEVRTEKLKWTNVAILSHSYQLPCEGEPDPRISAVQIGVRLCARSLSDILPFRPSRRRQQEPEDASRGTFRTVKWACKSRHQCHCSRE
ncbi:hypothetical protein GE09DRAFT_570686 [Coniochaeta sp. 2T2.1]|nr:hypothetical protein GE09DRAFT_570686 [Coniochaeta sp. 2T2.1]